MAANSLNQASNQNLLIFRSNVTPEISVDLDALLGPGQPPNEAMQGKSKLALNIIKPEIVLSALNINKTIAPYGIPEQGAWKYIFIGLIIAGLMGGGLTYSYCSRSPIYALAVIAITGLLVAELSYARQQA